MRIILLSIIAILLCSCEAVVVPDEMPTVTTVVRYGVPYRYDNQITYYHYKNYYYYPYYRNNMWYYHRYNKPVKPRRVHRR